jgi:DNA-directed RNA polymerase subunit RPC12/RpoP
MVVRVQRTDRKKPIVYRCPNCHNAQWHIQQDEDGYYIVCKCGLDIPITSWEAVRIRQGKTM